MAPQQIGQFTIVAELAKTEGGAVYKATDPKGRPVALRTLRLDAAGAAEVASLRAAAKAASALGSPNIAGIYGGGEAAGVFFIAVEFVEGVKLASNLAKGEPAGMSEVLDLSRQICYALDHAQGKGIVHPELKPSNIIVEWDGTAKIMDFGVPRTHPPGELSEATYYLSPEEARGEAVTPRSNLFSWAAITYHMATGRKPFDAEDAATLRRKIAEEMPPAPHEVNAKLPPRVSEILLKALAKDPGQRHASAAQFLAELEDYKRAPAEPPKAATPVKTPMPMTAPHAKPAAAPVAAPAPKPAAAAAVPVARPIAVAPAKPQAHPAAEAARPAAVAAKPAAAKPAAASSSRNLMLYGMGAAIVVLVGIVVALWMRSGPSQSGPGASAPQAAATSAPAESTTTAVPGGAATGAPRGTRARQPVAAAPVATSAPTGGLTVDSTPQGAEVQIDGRHEASWVTPFSASGLAAGAHSVSFSKPGHLAATRNVQVTAGQSAVVAVQLAEMAATLVVSSEPPGAAIVLDGKDTGKVTPAQLVVAKGSHSLTVRKAGYLEASNTLEAAPGQSVQFAPTLRVTGSTENIKTVGKLGGLFGGGGGENSGRVSVRSNPKGAQVLVNGQPVKKTTPVDFFLEPGSYEITVTYAGYKPVKKVVDIQKGSKLVLDETLAK